MPRSRWPASAADAAISAALGDLDDEVANTIAKTFAGEHIDVSRVLRVPGARSSVSLILIDAAGEKMIATRRDTGLTQAGPDDADAAVAEVDAVLLDNRYGNITVPICNAAKARGIPRVLDLDMAAPPDDPLVAGSTHVIASAEAIRDSTGLKGHAAALLKFGEVYKGFSPRSPTDPTASIGATGRRCATWMLSRSTRSIRSAPAIRFTAPSPSG